MQEVDGESVDIGGVLRETIEQGFPLAPVVPVRPVMAHLFDPGERRALAPVVDHFGLGPAGIAQPRAQIVEYRIADSDTKWFYGLAHDRCSFRDCRILTCLALVRMMHFALEHAYCPESRMNTGFTADFALIPPSASGCSFYSEPVLH